MHAKLIKKGGFSFVEVVVSLAIVGMALAAGAPMVQEFQAKFRQTQAKTELSSIHTYQKAYFKEIGAYHSSLPYIGYVPEGMPAPSAAPDCYDGNDATNIRFYTVGSMVGGLGNGRMFNDAGMLPVTCRDTFYESNVQATTRFPPNWSVSTAGTRYTMAARGHISDSSQEDEWLLIVQSDSIANPASKSLFNSTKGY